LRERRRTMGDVDIGVEIGEKEGEQTRMRRDGHWENVSWMMAFVFVNEERIGKDGDGNKEYDSFDCDYDGREVHGRNQQSQESRSSACCQSKR
jgi:hypothetical protein